MCTFPTDLNGANLWGDLLNMSNEPLSTLMNLFETRDILRATQDLPS